jgi:MFS family permease
MTKPYQPANPSAIRTGMKLVILLGLVSLFADMTYESARSISGPYLAILGASAATVGLVSGAGEFIGYGLRYVSGRVIDHTRQYWLLTALGYGINLLAVPCMALAGHWQLAALLLILERVGKAIRTPARDAILSHATQSLGRGWGFGLHRAMDQIGAMLGPLIMSGILMHTGNYKLAFGCLLIPAMLALLSLLFGPIFYPKPQELEVKLIQADPHGQSQLFWIYLAGAALLGAGYVDFPLIAFHFKKTGLANDVWIPIFYSAAMGMEALFAPVIGKWFDRVGMKSLAIASLLTVAFVPLVFYGGGLWTWLGMALWGLGLATQESAMKAAVAQMVPVERRGSGYGLFNMGYGISWFIGSAIMGILYDRSLHWLILFSVTCQLLALPFLMIVARRMKTA